MNKEQKLQSLKEKGWTYNKETGEVFSHTGRKITGINSNGYITCTALIGKTQVCVPAHQFAYYFTTGEVPNYVDHINRNRIDNRFINLRSVNNQQNSFNSKSKGFFWDKLKKKWHSQIMLNRKTIHLGLYDNRSEASKAYLEAKKIYHII